MSMKRSKEVSRGRSREVDGGFWDKKEPERVYVWDTDVATQPDAAFVQYAPAQRYAKDVLVTHSKFGKGIVTDVDGGKIDVLFQDGAKKLTHGLAGGPIIEPKVIEAEDEASAAVTIPAPPPTHMASPIIPDAPAVPAEAPSTDAPAAAPTTEPAAAAGEAPVEPPAPSETEPRHTVDPPTDPDPDPPPTGSSN